MPSIVTNTVLFLRKTRGLIKFAWDYYLDYKDTEMLWCLKHVGNKIKFRSVSGRFQAIIKGIREDYRHDVYGV